MKTILTAMALVLPLASYAAQPIQTSNLTFSNLSHEASWTSLPADVGLTVLSDQGGATTITTPFWDQVLKLGGTSDWRQTGDGYSLNMTLAPKAGYVITGFAFEATISGKLETPSGPPPGVPLGSFHPGMATNEGGSYLPDGKGGNVSKSLTDVTDPVQYSFARHDLSIDTATAFEFYTNAFIYSKYAWWVAYDYEGKIPSYAGIQFTDSRLTIYTALAPVPEPESWAMLLGGLALVGMAARRRKQ